MSSFSTNAGTRRGKRACYGVSVQNTQVGTASISDSTINKQIIKADTIQRKLQHATIGGDNVNGLTIRGTFEDSRMGATNPDDRTIPLGTSGDSSRLDRANDTLARPDFPIQLNGKGILTFPQPIKIKAIEGDLNVSGTITAGTIGSTSTVTNFTPVLTDFGGNFVNQTVSIGILEESHGIAHITVSIQWDSSASLDGSALEITGLPAMQEQIVLVHGFYGVAVNKVGAHLVGEVDAGTPTVLDLHEVDNTTFAASTRFDGTQVDTAGQLYFSAMVRLL